MKWFLCVKFYCHVNKMFCSRLWIQTKHKEPITIRIVPMQIARELINASHHYLDMRCVYFIYYHIWRYLGFSSWVFEFAQNIWILFIILFFASFWRLASTLIQKWKCVMYLLPTKALVEELVGSKSHLFCLAKN